MQKLLRTPVRRQMPDVRVGIEIAHSAVKLAAVRKTPAGPVLERFDMEPIPPGTVSEGIVRNPEAVVAALAALRKRADPGRTEVVTALPDTAVQFKVMRVARDIDPRKIVTMAQREARLLIRDPSVPISVDIALLGESTVDDQVQDLLLVAAKAVDVRRHSDLFRRAGWIPSVLEVDSMVVRHGVAQNPACYKSGAPIVALFDLGAGGIRLSVMRGDATVFHRARNWGTPITAEAPREAESQAFLDCVRSLLQGFHRHTGIEHIDQLRVTGGLSLESRWVAELADWVGLSAEPWQAEHVVGIGNELQAANPLTVHAHSFVAVSLALRGFE